ncbi:MAG: zinc metallopeptidase [Anaerolineae bacterium]|nr:zinc metallopeptidase [Thermoflexales bacterium]MDW8407370.1 zinc metallopeptidase [Anaerolineae bacterium]
MPFLFDPLYLVFALPGLLLALWAQFKVRSTFARYAQVPTSRGVNGLDTAKLLIRHNGLGHVGIQGTPGELTDHYDPRNKSIYLSDSSVQNSVASVAVVAHELGHAEQDAQGYTPLKLRGAIVPAVTVGSWVGPVLFMIGLLFQSTQLAWIGVIAFALTAVFALVTLPVEFDASRRALRMLQSSHILVGEELNSAKKVLDAAALTYVAAATQSILTLLYYVTLLTGMRRSED